MGILSSTSRVGGLFLGTAAPARLENLLRRVFASNGTLARAQLESTGLRNAIADAIALGLLDGSKGLLVLRPPVLSSAVDLIAHAKSLVGRQPAVQLALECLREAANDRPAAGARLAAALDATWKATSAQRYLGGLLRFAAWAGVPSADV